MENVLEIIDGQTSNERIALVLCHEIGQASHVELRQQSWGDGVGWFTQSTLALEPFQVAQLRNALGSHSAMSAGSSKLTPPSSPLRVVRAETG